MSCTFNCLYWMPTWMILSLCGVSTGNYGLSPSSPTTDSSVPSGLRGYRRYFANDSLIGDPVPCTRDEKTCFRYNLVFHPNLDKCQPLERGSAGCDLRINRVEFEQGSGRVVGSCIQKSDLCPGYRMAYDGICYKTEIVSGIICGQDGYPTRHPFGNYECRAGLPTPISFTQPVDDGYCVIPDVRFPDTGRGVFYNNPYTEIQGFKNAEPYFSNKPNDLECTSDQAACFSKRRVFLAGYEGCHSLLEQGPCAEDHVVALDLQAATEGRAEGTCVHVRGGCPKGQKRMLFDGQCHEDREIKLVAPGKLTFNQFGSYIVTTDSFLALSPAVNNKFCIIKLDLGVPALGIPVVNPPCGANDKGECNLREVVNEPPKPEF